jgi:hypothetical protein
MKNIKIKEGEWIDALPDKLILPCSLCGCRVDFDYHVDDTFWNMIVPKEHHLNVVCLNCLDVMATQKGENIGEHIEKVYYCGEGKTIDLLKRSVYLYNWDLCIIK